MEIYSRCRHMGHFSCELSCLSHEKMQCCFLSAGSLPRNVGAYHVKRVVTLAEDCMPSVGSSKRYLSRPTQRTLVARELALRASAVVGVAADTANIVVGHVPAPGSDGIPLPNRDLHGCLSAPAAVVRGHLVAYKVGRKQTAPRM